MMARFVGSGYVVFAFVAIPQFAVSAPAVASWFDPVAALAVFGPGFALLAATFYGSMRPLTWLSTCCVLGYFVAIGLWFVAFTGNRGVDPEVVSWLTSITDLPPLVAILSRPFWQAGVVLAGSVGGRIAILAVGRGGGFDERGIIDSLNVGVFGAFFILAFAIALRSGEMFDDSRIEALAASSRAAAATARNAERARFDGVVHDSVIAVLNAVRADTHDPRLPAQAAAAIAALDAVAAPQSSEQAVPRAEVLARLRTIATSVDERIQLQVSQRSPDETTSDFVEFGYPSDIVQAIVEAAGEALRNSVLHAGEQASRAMLVDTDSDSVWVSVVDDGDGFDPDAVAPERLGLRVSVAERMAGIAGGSSTVTSARGEGTVVDVMWTRP